jgi:hypothetical protein
VLLILVSELKGFIKLMFGFFIMWKNKRKSCSMLGMENKRRVCSLRKLLASGDLVPARRPGQRSISDQTALASNSDLWDPRASTRDSQK